MDRNSKNQSGFSLAELLTVLLIVSIIVGLAGAFSPKAAYRRSVDSVTTQVANTLQITKLSAARDGVEYITTFEEIGNPLKIRNLKLTTLRGDSNTDSTIFTSFPNNVKDIKLDSSVVISIFPDEILFEPVGQACFKVGADDCEDLDIEDGDFVILARGGARIDRCGLIRVEKLGRIGVIQGHWSGTGCQQVSD